MLFFGISTLIGCVGLTGGFVEIVPDANTLVTLNSVKNRMLPRELFFIMKNKKICIPIKYKEIQQMSKFFCRKKAKWIILGV